MACDGCAPWQDIHALVVAQCGPYTPTEGQTTRNGAGGTYHGCGSAEDFGCANYDCACANRVLEPLARSGQLKENCWTGTGGSCVDDGQDTFWTGHGDHNHAGCLTPGATGAGSNVQLVGAKSEVCIPGTPLCIPGLGDLAGFVKDALIALVMAFTGGKSLAEVAIRGMEVWGGAILMTAGAVMVLRVLKGTSIGGGIARAGRPAVRSQRQVRRIARRQIVKAAA